MNDINASERIWSTVDRHINMLERSLSDAFGQDVSLGRLRAWVLRCRADAAERMAAEDDRAAPGVDHA